MLNGKFRRERVRVLVKAYPQPSLAYDETVCVAAISEDGLRMMRLYPIRYRSLAPECRFDRFDQVEIEYERPIKDHRPESWHVKESSIRVIARGRDLTDRMKVTLWAPFVVASLTDLRAENVKTERSFGIVRPDPASLKFFVRPMADLDDEGQQLNQATFQVTQSLLEAPLAKLPPPEYAFGYRFSSGGQNHEFIIHDWEVQAAYTSYVKKYGAGALDEMRAMYGQKMPNQNCISFSGQSRIGPGAS